MAKTAKVGDRIFHVSKVCPRPRCTFAIPRPLASRKRSVRTYTAAEQEELMVKMTEARAAEVLPREALEEVPMTHFEYSR